jgi:hypothetical protein
MTIRVRSSAVLCLSLFLVGCSVGDYEAKMLESQNRLIRTEENNRLLEAGSIVMPIRIEKGIPYKDIDLFLRPPKGISTATSNEGNPRARLFTTFPPSRQGGAGPFSLVEVAFAPLKDQEFEKNVLAVFTASGQAVRRARTIAPPGRAPLNFSTVEFEDSTYAYSVNFIKGPSNQVAIVYWFGRASKPLATRAIEVSLTTCGIDKDADALRATPPPPLAVPQHPNK